LSRFVLDNTVTIAWCFTDEATDFAETLLNRLSDLTDTALVPALWLYEVVNVVELAVRKGRITKDKALGFLERVQQRKNFWTPMRLFKNKGLRVMESSQIILMKSLG
jgi:predicted nucleic acid-binding protein